MSDNISKVILAQVCM